MAAFYGRPYGEGFKGINLGEVLARGQQYREGEQAMQARAQAMKIAQAQEDAQARLRPLKQLGEELAIRGQIIGAGETADDFLAALPMLKQYELPTEDLPELRSTASETFRAAPKAPEAPRIAPSWMPQGWAGGAQMPESASMPITESFQNNGHMGRYGKSPAWMPNFEIPGMIPAQAEPTVRDLPTGSMVEPADLQAIQRRAQIGLPLEKQEKFRDADIGRQIQLRTLSRNLDKDALSREWMAFQREAKIQGMTEAETQRQFQRMMADKDYQLDVARFVLAEKAAQREAAKPTLNEGQAKAVLFGQEVAASLVDFEDLLGKGFDPTGIKGTADVALSGMGFGSEDAKIWNNASDQLAQAALRFESGAAIGEQEFGKKIRANVPKFGDSPAVVRRKLDAIRRAKEAFESYTGKTFRSTAAGSAASNAIPTVASQAAYDALPPGAKYKAPDGRILTKKAR